MDLPANVSIHLGLNFIKVEQNRGRSPDQGSEVNRHRRRSMKEAPIFTSDERRHRDEGSFDMHQLVTTARSQRRTLSVAEAATQSSSGRHGQAQGVGGQRQANHGRLAVGREQLAIQERRVSEVGQREGVFGREPERDCLKNIKLIVRFENVSAGTWVLDLEVLIYGGRQKKIENKRKFTWFMVGHL
ncbi:hypothetical protein NL676_023782 [Syzygium grande]|nr:hypothetical protein NL676_023782 [Syzygium grande]